jgi:HK97 gp10 family phage protein
MAGSAMTLTGATSLRRRLQLARRDARTRLKDATEEALTFLEAKAKEILDREIYEQPHPGDPAPPNKSDPDALYNHFQQALRAVGSSVVGTLANDSDHAVFVEFGTERGGPARHFMERALREHRAEVVAIYRRHFDSLFG